MYSYGLDPDFFEAEREQQKLDIDLDQMNDALERELEAELKNCDELLAGSTTHSEENMFNAPRFNDMSNFPVSIIGCNTIRAMVKVDNP